MDESQPAKERMTASLNGRIITWLAGRMTGVMNDWLSESINFRSGTLSKNYQWVEAMDYAFRRVFSGPGRPGGVMEDKLQKRLSAGDHGS